MNQPLTDLRHNLMLTFAAILEITKAVEKATVQLKEACENHRKLLEEDIKRNGK